MGFEDMHELQQSQMDKLGNKGINGAKEIIQEVCAESEWKKDVST